MSTATTPRSGSTWDEWTQQLQAYVAWVNSQLRKRAGCRLVEDLKRDLRDGVTLIHLVEIISGEKLGRVDFNPQTLSAMRENVDTVLQFMAAKRIRMHLTSAKDIIDGNLKSIMRLILALAAHYKPSSVKHPQRQTAPSMMAVAAGAAAALHSARKEAASVGQPMKKYHRSPSVPLHSAQATTKLTKNTRPTQRASPTSQRLNMSLDFNSPLLPGNTSPGGGVALRPPGIQRSPAAFTSDSDQASADETQSTHSSSSPSATATLREEYQQMEGQLIDTKKALSQLQDLLLNGHSEAVGSDAEEDYIPFEGTTHKEQVVVLKARLDQSQGEVQGFKTELSKARQDCRNLQGVKAGLQNRLTEQDNALLQLKAEMLRVGFNQQQLEAENSELKRSLDEKHKTISDLSKQIEQKNSLLEKQQAQIEEITCQLQDVNNFKAELQNQVDEKDDLAYSLRCQLKELGQRLEAVGMTEATLAARMATQDRNVARLQHKLTHSGPGPPGPPPSNSWHLSPRDSEELHVVREALHNLRGSFGTQDPQHHMIDTLEQSIVSLMERLKLRDSRNNSDTSSTESGSWVKHRHESITKDSRRSPITSLVPGFVPQQDGSGSTAINGNHHNSTTTKVLYFTEKTVTPFMSSIPKRLGEITLGDFKSVIDRHGNYRYHFKVLDPEFGTVKEEIVSEEELIPGWEGKIVAWVEEDED